MAGGRPTDYTEELSYEICERIVNGESLSAICRDESMPCVSTVYRWIDENNEFKDRYVRAREDQADTLSDELLEIADNSTNDYMERQEGGVVLNSENIQRSKLRVDTRKWIASKLKPKKYGDKTAIVGDRDADPINVDVTDRTLNNVAFLMRKAMEEGKI